MTLKITPPLLAVMATVSLGFLQGAEQRTFKTADQAGRALVGAAQRGAREEVVAILGDGIRDALSSGNPSQDQMERAILLRLAAERLQVRPDTGDASRAIVYLGNDEWPFPVPLIKSGAAWSFDTKEGIEEIRARAIGRNELGAIAACLAFVDAQIEYASADRTGDGILQFAQKVQSSPGKRDGLFWPNDKGDDPSPLGPFVAESAIAAEEPGAKPAPFFGYRYRILTAQGEHAVGGARGFLVGGHMLGGFALIAWPAEYGVTGYGTFIVNQLGDVYERDLGANTSETVESVKVFDPDSNWSKVE